MKGMEVHGDFLSGSGVMNAILCNNENNYHLHFYAIRRISSALR
jgi:hypothetical protein